MPPAQQRLGPSHALSKRLLSMVDSPPSLATVVVVVVVVMVMVVEMEREREREVVQLG